MPIPRRTTRSTSPTATTRSCCGRIDGATLPGLGQAWSTPVITRVNISGATQNSQRLVLVIGGGYDAMEDNSTFYAADTVGNHVYMVDALTGNLLWSAGKTGANFNSANMDHAIPSPVAVLDIDGNGYADRMYVGDMAAQLWRFDITNGNTAASLVAGGVIASLGTKLDAVHAAADQRRFYSAPDVAAEQKPKLTPFLSIAIGSGYRGHPLNQTDTRSLLRHPRLQRLPAAVAGAIQPACR